MLSFNVTYLWYNTKIVFLWKCKFIFFFLRRWVFFVKTKLKYFHFCSCLKNWNYSDVLFISTTADKRGRGGVGVTRYRQWQISSFHPPSFKWYILEKHFTVSFFLLVFLAFILFSVSLSVCLSSFLNVCLSICLFVCL